MDRVAGVGALLVVLTAGAVLVGVLALFPALPPTGAPGPGTGWIGQGLWEVRSTLPGNRIARVIFCIAQGRMVLLHGFLKKTQRIPNEDLALARRRMEEIEQ